MLKLYNSFFNIKETIDTIRHDEAKMYVCGPTVYDEIHIGNARSVIVFDLLYRVLKKQYSVVKYVRNITDIDDKIINKAKLENRSCSEVAAEFEARFKENCSKLQLLPPTCQPRATDVMEEIIESIASLIENGYAYIEEDQVYFDVASFKEYGALSKQKATIAGARIEIILEKHDSRDFILWKRSEEGQPYWNSAWGKGRPGWHIECTAMSKKFLGEQFDIHGGGQDLIFPHHENEIAQNVGLYGKLAGPRYWVHNAMVLLEGEKMSKSLGNIIKLSSLFEHFDPIFVKFFILSTHYRHALLWSTNSFNQAIIRYKRWMYHLQSYKNESVEILDDLYEILLDDLNSVQMFAEFDKLLDEGIHSKDDALLKKLYSTLSWLGCVSASFSLDNDAALRSYLNSKLTIRQEARSRGDYEEADKIRKEIESFGYEIEDSTYGAALKKIC